LEAAREVGSVVNDDDYIKYKSKKSLTHEEAMFYVSPGWGTGGFWDTTPNKLDNQYYIELNATDASEKNNCCGPSTEHGCGTDELEGAMQNKNGTEISGCDSNVNWCMRSAGKTTGFLSSGNPKDNDATLPDYIMMSTKEYVQSDTPMVTFRGATSGADADIGIHRVYRLAADWALIDDSEAKVTVAEFAANETAFHAAFGAVWAKVIELGHEPGTLSTCAA
jgi:uncharacterized protein YraI